MTILKVRYGADGYDLYSWGMTILKVRYGYGTGGYDCPLFTHTLPPPAAHPDSPFDLCGRKATMHLNDPSVK